MNATSDWSSTDNRRRAERMVTVWSLAWALAFLGANLAITREWIGGGLLTGGAIALVAALSIGWVRAYELFLRAADELMRKIQLDALAVAVGGGFVIGFALILFESAGLTDARVDYVLVGMVVAYIATVVRGLTRFGGGEG